MRPLRPALATLMAALCLALPRAQAGRFSLFSPAWGNVIVATDTTPEGRELTPPTPGNPVYYLGQSLGCRLGSIPGDRLPDDKKMSQFVAEVLAKQGYVGATLGVHEPTLFMVLQWGYLQPQSGDLLWFLGYDANKDIGAPTFPGLLGPEVFRVNFRSHTIETILDHAKTANYGIIVTAFEYQSASTPKPVIYWQTRIALPANGKSMSQALPTMVLAAGPSIGRESDSPVLRSADDVNEGHVELGELQVLGFEEVPAPAKKDSGAKK